MDATIHMKRSAFIKNIIGFFGVTVLPKKLLTHYTRIYLLQCFVRGFQYYEGPGLISQMKPGDLLSMVRETGNEYDPCAIALHYNNKKIGFIPAEQNELLSRLMDARLVELVAEITHLEPDAATWENVHAAVYVLKKDSSLPPQAIYLTTLETPEYYTLKHSADKLSRIVTTGDDIISGEDFYAALVENSETDDVYSLIHNDIGSPQAMEEIVNNNLLVVNRDKLPADLQNDTLTQALEEGAVALDDAFDENGFVVAQVNRVAQLSARIGQFKEIADKKGQRFWEVVFRE